MIANLSYETSPNFKSRKNLYHSHHRINRLKSKVCGHDISAQVRFITASFEIVGTDTFPTSTKMRRLSVLQKTSYIETSHSLMSLHGRILA